MAQPRKPRKRVAVRRTRSRKVPKVRDSVPIRLATCDPTPRGRRKGKRRVLRIPTKDFEALCLTPHGRNMIRKMEADMAKKKPAKKGKRTSRQSTKDEGIVRFGRCDEGTGGGGKGPKKK